MSTESDDHAFVVLTEEDIRSLNDMMCYLFCYFNSEQIDGIGEVELESVFAQPIKDLIFEYSKMMEGEL